ncbi:spore germination protein KC [Paenibacillus taihuensis]|uniref:Spore germination protein KC n=1 Tax=Paenibacillus taihuensis TaxID=1156355 RepID=A0A3D9S754_9BACL|nr:Ger(x)C family spore germination protein [Paenibacillus taihuensis]REE89010.1 spore germination protein KC [Paenibacillus taihuensis]
MKHLMKQLLCLGLLANLLLLSGCWDRTEINDLAFITGSAFDLSKSGKYILSIQIAIPQGGTGSGDTGQQEKFFVLSAEGSNASEAFELIQKKSSRRLFTAHRSVIFIGESLGRRGINDVLDVFAHDPRQRLRTYIMVVKGGEGKRILETRYPFEQVSVESIKELEGLDTEVAVTLRDYYISASSQGISPVMGVIEPEVNPQGGEKRNELYRQAGTAIFKDAKLVGILNGNETSGFLWAADRMKQGRINAVLPNGQGIVGIVLNATKRRMVTEVQGDKVKVKLKLQGKGSIVENNTHLDVSRPKNRALVEQVLEKSIEEQVRHLISQLQKKYRADSLGIGQELYREHPKLWKQLQNSWEDKFPEAEVSVAVQLSILGSGMAGPPLQFNDKEIIK